MTVLLTASLGLLLAAPPAPALIIVDVDGPPQMMGLSGQATRALVDAAKAAKRPVVTQEELRQKLPAKDYQALLHCAGSTACVAGALSSYGPVGLVVTGELGRDEKNYLLKLWLHDVPQASVVTEIDRAILIASRRFTRDLNQLVGPFLRGEKDSVGTLKLVCAVKGADVYVNGELVGSTPFERKLTPAKYEVRVEKKKYLAVVRLIDVFPDKTTSEEIRLLLKPGETADPEPSAAKVAVAVEPEGPAFRPSVGTWVAGGAMLVAGAVGLGFGLKMSGGEKALLQGFNKDTNRYQGTRAQALQVGNDAIVADVAFAIAGAAAIVTAILVVFDVQRMGSVEVAPAAGPGVAGLVLGGTF